MNVRRAKSDGTRSPLIYFFELAERVATDLNRLLI
jgi:hypothetical protein